MPIETDLNISPYFDDYDESKNYHRVLFKPAVPLQAREITQLQTMLQTQVERFGDYNFKEGTIVKGCAFSFDNTVKYVKVLDRSPDTNLNVNLAAYAKEDYIRHDTSNLVSQIVDTRAGFEAQNPDLASLFLHYINTGNNSGTVKKAYANSDVLSIIPKATSINAIAATVGGAGFDVNDKIYLTSPNATGAGFVGTVATVSSNAIATVSVDNDSTAGRNKGGGYSLLDYPYVSEIKRGDATVWTTTSHSGNGVIIGTYANGQTNQTLTLPITLTREAQVTVAGDTFTAPTGSSYEMKVEDGIVYQKGNFQRFAAQSVIVSPFTSRPDGLSVGIVTEETIANSSVDTSLLDNASGFNNENAPGADRLKLTPVLSVNTTVNVAASNNFLSFVEFQNGLIVHKNQTPVLNRPDEHLAQRTYEESGDYVLEPIRVSTDTNAGNTTHLNVLVGKGTAYVRGKRFETINTSRHPIKKATSTSNSVAHTITTNFGHYVKVNELVGHFGSDSQANVVILDTALNGISGGMAATITSNSTHITSDGRSSKIIGHAKIRALELESDNAGHADSVYQAYLYDIKMNSGQAFKNARAIGSVNTLKGIADFVDGAPKILDADFNKSVFKMGARALKNVSGVATMKKKSLFSNKSIDATNGNTSISAASGNKFNFGTATDEYLNETQEQQIIITARGDATGPTIASGADSSGTTVTDCVDTTSLRKGDNVMIGTAIRQITRVVNSTTLEINEALTASNVTLKRAFVNNHVIPLSDRSTANVQIKSAGSELVFNFGTGALSGALPVDILIDEVDPTSAGLTKSVQVSTVRINPSADTTGPWCLGIPDGISLKSVRVNGSSTYAVSGTDAKGDFVLDNGQRDGLYGMSYLKLAPNTTRTIASTDRIVVELKHFNKSNAGGDGFFTIKSYDGILNDKEGAGVTASDANISIAEIPVYVSPTDGAEINLRDAVDFRPYVTSTATKGVALASFASATENPSATEALDATGLVSPVPNETWTDEIQYYLPRKDRVVIEEAGIAVLHGTPSLNPELPAKPETSMQIATIDVPPYPSLDGRLARYYGRPDMGSRVVASQQKRFTMEDISGLEKRINNLEYYSSLNALETLTVDQTIPGRTDATTNRFKNGFLVDNFTTMTAGNPLNAEYKAGFDQARQLLTSRFERYNIELEPILGDSSKSIFQTDIATVKYRTKNIIDQPTATGTRRCTSMFWEYNGTLNLFPNYVSRTDKVKSPEVAMDIEIDVAGSTLALIDELNKMAPDLGTEQKILETSFTRGNQIGESVTQDGIETTTYEAITKRKINKTTKSLSATTAKTTQKVGDFVTDISFQPYIPAVRIHFTATGLRPDLTHHVFFDGVQVDRHVVGAKLQPRLGGGLIKWGRGISARYIKDTCFPIGPRGPGFGGSTGIKTDSRGRLTGILNLPAGVFFTGKSKVIVADIENLSDIGDKVSSASAEFQSFNFSVDTAEIKMTTRHAIPAHSSSSQIINTKVKTGTDTIITGVDLPEPAESSANTTPPDDDDSDRNPPSTPPEDDFDDTSNTIIDIPPISNTIVTPPPANTGPSIGRCEILDPCEDRYHYRYNHYHHINEGHHFHHYRDPLCCFDVPRKGADPLAQTFLVSRGALPTGANFGYLSHLNLYFSDKDPNTGVVVELREVVNGVPGPRVLPFSRVHYESSEVNVSTNGTTATRIDFDSPVGVEAGKEYAIVILPDGNSPNYSVFTSKAGEQDLLNQAKQVNNDWGTGTMFLSTNNRTWTEYLDEDMKFQVHGCFFGTNKSKVRLKNRPYEFLTLKSGTEITGNFVAGAEVFKGPSDLTTIHKAGTLAYSTDSSTITGTGTNFTTDYAAGNRIVLQKKASGAGSYTFDIVTVDTVSSATSMTIKEQPGHTATVGKGMLTPSGIFSYLDPITKTSQIEFSTAASGFVFANNDILYQAGNYETSNSELEIVAGVVPNFQIGEVVDTNISSYQAVIGRSVPEGTTVVTKLKAAKISDNSYSTLAEVKLNDTNMNDEPIKVMSRSNEIQNNSGNPSVILEHTLSTQSLAVSPTIDFQDQGLNIYENSLNNSDANEWKTYQGSALSKYVSRTVTLAKDLDAEDLKVFVNAYSPVGTEIKVYAKLINESDTTTSDNAYWSELDCTANKDNRSSSVDRSDLIEYTYELKDAPEAVTQTGQMICTDGSASVTGAGTDFATEYNDGDKVLIVNLDDKLDYQINTVEGEPSSATAMTFAEPMKFNNVGAIHKKLSDQGKVTAFRDPKATVPYQATYFNDAGEKFVGYKRMSIKIVILSDDNTKSPAVQDYRAIALSL